MTSKATTNDDDDMDVLALLVELRGGVPDACDFCTQPMKIEDAIPEEAGDWACRTCCERWEKEEKGGGMDAFYEPEPKPEERRFALDDPCTPSAIVAGCSVHDQQRWVIERWRLDYLAAWNPNNAKNVTVVPEAALLEAQQERDEAVRLLKEVWNSVPGTYDPSDKTVVRHAKALNAIHAFLARIETEKP